MNDFNKIGLKKIAPILKSIGFSKPTDVQSKVIPLTIQGKNVVFTSQTGSGKTLAFLLGFLNKINIKFPLQMIVLVPTRELCIQVGKEFKKVCDPLSINVGVIYGGRDIAGDYRTLTKKNQIMVATPGRIIQHINEKHIKVGDVKFLVFDESDQMFDNGFYDDCAYIKKRVSKNAQNILSSATITNKVTKFIESQIKEYELLKIGDQIPKNIIQEHLFCKIPEKNDILLDFLQKKNFKRVLVFCNTKIRTDSISKFLEDNRIRAKPMTGDLEQRERNNRLNLFKEGKIPVLVTTDVAARGLHIENVDIVVNFDMPTREEFYVHRIGRTGRNKQKGYSISFVCPEDEERFLIIKEDYKINFKEISKTFG